MKKTIKSLLLSAVAMVLTLSAYAQVTTSALGGKVTDAQGAVVGAAVIATHTPSGTQYFSVTDKDGQYRINSIVPGGPYTIKVEMLGYASLTITDVIAPLAETFIADATLKEEAIGLEAATVSADASTSGMNIHRSGASTTISERTKDNMPSVSRSMNDILALTPQASSTSSGLAVGGGNYRGSTVTVDGAAFNNMFGIGQNLPAGGTPISLDALEQISVNVTPYDVRQSGFQGGAINAVTKSGSNEWHASVYDYYTSAGLRGYKVDGKEVGFSPAFENTIGVTVGGPIVKNKLFFFVNAEYTPQASAGPTTKARPNEEEAWGKGTTYNRPTESKLNEITKFLQDNCGYNPGRYQDYSLKTPAYKVLARIDWNINQNNKFNIRFSHTSSKYSSAASNSTSPIGSNFYSYGNTTWGTTEAKADVNYNKNNEGRKSPYTIPFENTRYYQTQNYTSLAAELNTRFADGKGTNTARVAWSHQYEPRSYDGGVFPTVDILESYDEGKTACYTTFGLDPFTYNNLRDVQAVTVTDEISYQAGKNTIIAGLQYEYNNVVNGFQQCGNALYVYDTWEHFTQDVLNPTAESAPVGFMITHANSGDGTGKSNAAFDFHNASAYVQDEVAFSDNFKLTAGIRFEMPFYKFLNDNENKDFTAVATANPNSSFANLKTSDLPCARLSVAPRVGFNWDITKGARKVILRGGTGLYTGRIPNVWLVSAVGNANTLQYQYIAADNAVNGNTQHFQKDRSAIINTLWNGSFEPKALSAPTSTTILAKDLRMPTSWKSSLALDVVLPGDIKGTVEGIYSYNIDEVYASLLGYKQDGAVWLPGEPETRQKWVSEGVKNNVKEVEGKMVGTGKAMSGYYAHNVTGMHGWYYSVSAQLSKSFKNGIDLMAAYTHSDARVLSDANSDQVSGFAGIYNKNGNNAPELGYSSYTAPDRVIANASWTIKEGKYTATKLSIFYEGYNLGYNSSGYSNSRFSYCINNVSISDNGSLYGQTLYIPTEEQLKNMPFTSDENKQAYAEFLATDKYCKNHRGEYALRNCCVAPWLNRINARVAQDFYFDIAGKKQNVEVGVDFKNIANMFNSKWGILKQLSTETIMTYKDSKYTFTAPTWTAYNSTASTWQMLLSIKYKF